MAKRHLEIIGEEGKGGTVSYAVYIVDTVAGRVKLVGGLSHSLALHLALSQQRSYGAIIDRTRSMNR